VRNPRAAITAPAGKVNAAVWFDDVITQPATFTGASAMKKELKGVAGAMNGLSGRLLASLPGEAQTDPEIREALLSRLFHPRMQHTAGAIVRAQAAGDVRPDVPPLFAVDLFFGPLFCRMFVQHAPVSEAFVKQVSQYVLEGLKPRNSKRK